MIALAISILWLLIGIIILAGVIYLAIKVLKIFIPGLDPKVEQAIWLIFLILCLIGALMLFAGGGGYTRLPTFR